MSMDWAYFEVGDLELDDAKPGYALSDLVDKNIIVWSLSEYQGKYGEALWVHFSFGEDQPIGRFITSGVVLTKKLRAAEQQKKLPLRCRIVRPGRYYDLAAWQEK